METTPSAQTGNPYQPTNRTQVSHHWLFITDTSIYILPNMKPKHYIREVRRFLKSLSEDNAYIISGLGRCGTTLMQFALIESRGLIKSRRFLSRFSDEKNFVKGTLYKTHSAPPVRLPPHVKLVFMFGDPMNAALSGYKEFSKENDKHFQHIGASEVPDREDIFSRDVLMLEQHFDAWYQRQGFDFISVRYETLYTEETQSMLAEYLGFRLKLPPYRQRSTDWHQHERRDELAATYAGIGNKIEAADDCRIWLGKV